MGTARRNVMLAAIILALGLTVVGFITGTDRTDRSAMLFIGSVAILAGTLIYLLATDDYQARQQIFGAEAADRRSSERD